MVLNKITRQCEVSLPQKTSLICQRKRVLERQTMKKIWKLTKSPFGFMVLDRTPIEHVFKTFVDPFSRFNMEQYLQIVLTSDLTHSVYNVLVKNVGEIEKHYNYKVLSKYFAMASKLGGVSIIFSSRRLWYAWLQVNSSLCNERFSNDQAESTFDNRFCSDVTENGKKNKINLNVVMAMRLTENVESSNCHNCTSFSRNSTFCSNTKRRIHTEE